MIKDVKYAKYYMDNEGSGKIIKIDSGFTAITGYSWEDVESQNMTILDLVPEESREEYMHILREAINVGEAYLNHGIKCKDGSIITVNCYGEVYIDDKTKHGCSKILIIDVTEHEKVIEELNKKEEQLELQIEKIKILTENAREIFVDYDISEDKLEISRFIDGEYEIFLVKDDYLKQNSETVYEGDFEKIRELIGNVKTGDKRAALDFRTKLFSEDYKWYRLVYAKYINPKTMKEHVIGRLMDINDDKIASLRLEMGAEVDALTGIYTRQCTEEKIDELICVTALKAKHTMLLIDIDNMGIINQTYGIDKGDELIKKISDFLCYTFRQNFDIIGRVDGDAFVVFIRNTKEIDYIEERCSRICNTVKEDISSEIFDDGYTATVSIGIAIGDDKINSFKRIYKKAAKALQNQKENGRDGFDF